MLGGYHRSIQVGRSFRKKNLFFPFIVAPCILYNLGVFLNGILNKTFRCRMGMLRRIFYFPKRQNIENRIKIIKRVNLIWITISGLRYQNCVQCAVYFFCNRIILYVEVM